MDGNGVAGPEQHEGDRRADIADPTHQDRRSN